MELKVVLNFSIHQIYVLTVIPNLLFFFLTQIAILTLNLAIGGLDEII